MAVGQKGVSSESHQCVNLRSISVVEVGCKGEADRGIYKKLLPVLAMGPQPGLW